MSRERDVATKSTIIELPLKLVRNKNGRLVIKDEGNRSEMHNCTKKFLEECNFKFGTKQKLKHIFIVKDPFTSLDGTAMKNDSSNERLTEDPLDPEYEEILDISEIINQKADHVYVSMVPYVRYNQAK